MATLSSHPAPRSSKPQLASDRGSNVAGAPYDRPRPKGPCNNEVRTALCSMGLARQVEGTHVAAPTKSPPSQSGSLGTRTRPLKSGQSGSCTCSPRHVHHPREIKPNLQPCMTKAQSKQAVWKGNWCSLGIDTTGQEGGRSRTAKGNEHDMHVRDQGRETAIANGSLSTGIPKDDPRERKPVAVPVRTSYKNSMLGIQQDDPTECKPMAVSVRTPIP